MSKYLVKIYAEVSDQGPGPIIWFDAYDSLREARVAAAQNIRRLHHVNARIPYASESFLAEHKVIIITDYYSLSGTRKFGPTWATIELVETSRD